MTIKLLKGGAWRGFGGAKSLGGSSAPPEPSLPILSTTTYLSPGGTRPNGDVFATDVARRIPLRIPVAGVGIQGIRVRAIDTGASWTVKRCYIASDPNATTITEDFATGLQTVVGSNQVIPGTGSPTDNQFPALGPGIIPVVGGTDATIIIEVAAGAPVRKWGSPLATVGINPVYTGAEFLLGMNTLPSSGVIDYADHYPPNGAYPNILVEFVLDTEVVTVFAFGDSHMQPLGDGGGINDLRGLAARWSLDWIDDSLPYIPVQMGWQGQHTGQVLSRAQGVLRDLDVRCAAYQASSINNWKPEFSIVDPAGQGLLDLAAAKAAFGSRPFWPILGDVGNSMTAPQKAALRGAWDTVKSVYGAAVIDGVEASDAINPVTMEYESGYNNDPDHLNTAGYDAKANATYPQLTARIATAIASEAP